MNIDNLSGIFNGKVLGKKTQLEQQLKKGVLKAEFNAFKGTVKKPDMIGWNRMKKQKNLNLFGDADGDKVLNIFDCQPYNKKKDGIEDKMKNFFSGQGWTDIPQQTVKVIQPMSPLEPVDTRTSGQRRWDSIKQGIGNVVQASGAPQALEERKKRLMFEQDIKDLARQQAIIQAEQSKVDDIYQQELQKAARLQMQKQGSGGIGLGQDIRRGFNETQAALKASAGTIQTGIGAAAPLIEGQKIDRLVGVNPSQGQGISMMSQLPTGNMALTPEQKAQMLTGIRPTPAPQQVVSPQPIQTQSTTQQTQTVQQDGPPGPPPEPGLIWSHKSKRWVKYTRKPYQSRKQEQQQFVQPVQQQQFVQPIQQPQYY